MPERPWFQDPVQFFAGPAVEEPPAAGAELAVPQVIHPPQYVPSAPLPEVRYDRSGQPLYAYVPAAYPAQDVRSQRMIGCGVMAFGVGAGVALVEAGSYLMFAGMALATHAVIGVATAFVASAVAVVAMRTGGGVRIGSFHQGDNSTFQAGR